MKRRTKEERRERYERIESDPYNREYRLNMVRSAKKRAKRKNLFFDLKAEDIHMGEKCPILDIPFEVGTTCWYNSPSLDRIDTKRGYEPDNVIVVCMMANSIKNQATPEQIKKVGDFYAKLYEEKSINVS